MTRLEGVTYKDGVPVHTGDAHFREFRKKVTTLAAQMSEPFCVETTEGPLCAEAGAWLAKDSRGYFYPIAEDEFAAIYEPVERAAAGRDDTARS